jgi:putative iron-dependent peroxidase
VARHQYAVFAEGTRAHHHVELRVRAGVEPSAVAAALVGVRVAGADHLATGGVNLAVGIGPALWSALAPGRVPEGLRDFPGYHNDEAGLHAPATQADLWLWAHGAGPDSVLDVVLAATAALAPVADVTLDQPCFTYHDSRDLTGFIDGSANPGPDEAPSEAEIPAGRVGEAGSFALTMRYEHDLQRFHALPVDEQELVIGRTKPDSVALPAERRPADAHISRAEVADESGEELTVYRRSVPFADATTQGLFFVSFGQDLDRIDQQLRSMYGLADDGVVDRLLSFTQAHTGSFWLCPSVEDLDAVAPVPEDDED